MRCAMVILVVLGVSSSAQAADPQSHGCDACGGHQPLHRVCRLVCETEEVTETKWGCRYEDICLPGPSEDVCCAPGHPAHCSGNGADCRVRRIPTCGKVLRKKRLLRYEYTVEVPVYKWVVESLCDRCAAAAPSQNHPAFPGPPARSESPLVEKSAQASPEMSRPIRIRSSRPIGRQPSIP